MITHPYPGCCSVQVVAGFGIPSVEAGVKELQAIIKANRNNLVALTAITNISQKKGIKVLRALGFTRTRSTLMKPSVYKKTGTYNKIYIWYFEMSTEKVKKALAVDPKEV